MRAFADLSMASYRWPLLWAWLLALVLEPVWAQAQDRDAQAPSLAVARALYQYHQGDLPGALARLPGESRETGAAGPEALLRGRLQLAYGMIGAAQTLFETTMTPSVAVGVRNQAWLELGQAFYLQGKNQQAAQTLARLDEASLRQQAPGLHHHWLYLRGQLALRAGDAEVQTIIASLPATSLWQAYLRHNLGVRQLQADQLALAGETLTSLLEDLRTQHWEGADQREARALEEQVALGLGQLQLRQQAYPQAMVTLSRIPLDRSVSDRALLFYAIAASHNEAHDRALAALEHLQQRLPLAPAAQQVPVARGHVYEQLEQPATALRTYSEAVSYYEARLAELEIQRNELSESSLVGALAFHPGEDDSRPAWPLAAHLGSEIIAVDRSGYLPVEPARPGMAPLLVGDAFQQALARLHELYRLQDTLEKHSRRLGIFTALLETRATERKQRIEETREALARASEGRWLERQSDYQQAIHNAIQNKNTGFFMNSSQADTQARITRLLRRLDTLPLTAVTMVQRHRAERIRAYFEQKMADSYPQQSRQARKALTNLNVALAEFRRRQQRLEAELAREPGYEVQLARIEAASRRIDELQGALAGPLAEARSELLAQAEASLDRQQARLDRYLLSARQALSRVSDQQLQAIESNRQAVTPEVAPRGQEVTP